MSFSEEEIIKGCIKENPKFQRVLYDLYCKKMYALCLRYASDVDKANDILQEGFIRVFDKINTFKFQGSLEGWIRKIIVHVALRYIKSKNNIQFQELPINNVAENSFHISYDMCSEKELLEYIKKLPTNYRTVFNLYAIEGYSHEEISEMLQIAIGTSKSTLSRARVMLQEKLKLTA